MNRNADPAITEAVRRALIDAAESAYEDAGIRGLCAEGRWEAAVQAMRGVDVEAIVRQAAASADPHPSASGRTNASHG
ncbi:MAG TPA: hypothetical protein VFR37_03760 [Longimicrobium sp.]|nr:hypothetical protein [Longimicrobium sp.]